jgi:hypothetical protein
VSVWLAPSTFEGVSIVNEARSGSTYCNWIRTGYWYYFELYSGLNSNFDMNSGTFLAQVSLLC